MIASLIDSGSLGQASISGLSSRNVCCVFAALLHQAHWFPRVLALFTLTVNPFVAGSSPAGGAKQNKGQRNFQIALAFVFSMA